MAEAPIPWSGLDNPEDYDLCLKRPEGYYDLINGHYGWIVYCPINFDGAHAFNGRFCRVMGHVPRAEALAVAEAVIRRVMGGAL